MIETPLNIGRGDDRRRDGQMPQRLAMGECVVGTRSLLRAIKEGTIRIAYIGNDADLFIRSNAPCTQSRFSMTS